MMLIPESFLYASANWGVLWKSPADNDKRTVWLPRLLKKRIEKESTREFLATMESKSILANLFNIIFEIPPSYLLSTEVSINSDNTRQKR